MKLVLISDTHSWNEAVSVPSGDVLVHAGDLSGTGSMKECQAALDWLNSLPHEQIVSIAGNHDFAFEREYLKAKLNLGRVQYLENSSVTIDGVHFYGSPVQPEFMNWAFNVPRGPAIKKYWDMIPEHVDVLVTHGPPMGILDMSSRNGDHLGCEDLIKQVEISLPRVHVFGHIHGGYGHREYRGVNFFNASVVNEAYKVSNPAHVFEL